MTGPAKCETLVDDDSTTWCDVTGDRDDDDVTGNVVVFVVADVECGLLLPGTLIKTKP